MQADDFNSDFPWITAEMKNQIQHRDKIVKDQDIEGLFLLTDNNDFSIALYEILNNRCNYNPDILNSTEKVLFFCMHLENAGQADHILSFLQEDFSKYGDAAVDALNEISASKSALIIKEAVKLLPENRSWFFENADEKSQNLMSKLDSEFSSYPDGPMRDLYRKYAERHRSDF